jgi:hypothetical protein
MKILLTILAIVAPLSLAANAGQPLDRVISESIRLRVPVGACAAPGIAVRISRSLEIPAGIEYFPEVCRPRTPDPSSEEVEFSGLTAKEALDKLVGLDPRYRWLESDGVVVFRPLAASTDPTHFLHQSIPDFTITDVGIARAFGAVQGAIGPHSVSSRPDVPERTPQGNQHFSVTLGATSPFEALNAIARAHGSMMWLVTYCKPEARVEFAEFRFFTFDGSGGGYRSDFPRDEKGKTFDPCR